MYLGHVISSTGVTTDSDKADAIQSSELVPTFVFSATIFGTDEVMPVMIWPSILQEDASWETHWQIYSRVEWTSNSLANGLVRHVLRSMSASQAWDYHDDCWLPTILVVVVVVDRGF